MREKQILVQNEASVIGSNLPNDEVEEENLTKLLQFRLRGLIMPYKSID